MEPIFLELQSLLKEFLQKRPDGEKELADSFQVASSAVRRWTTGVARPHPKIARMIIANMKEKIEAGK